ncbi:MAG: spondin domain-containing protein [bacterium]|nr:spondin domain-containing protein [bacterium]
MNKCLFATAIGIIGIAVVLTGCSDDSDPVAVNSSGDSTEATGYTKTAPGIQVSEGKGKRSYEVTIENLSTGQPMSPPVAATHKKGIRMFKVGKKASSQLESIAEDGNQIPMVELLSTSSKVTDVVDVGRPLTRQGTVVGSFTDNATFMIQAKRSDRFSLATMLICTNDGFTGLTSIRLPDNGSETYYLKAYDAGTEQDTELSTDIVDACSGLGAVALPGDPNGNENDAVDSDGKIRPHRGIRGEGDLSEADHGWEGAVAKVTITRVEERVTYSVTIKNMSSGQPLSPPVVATHRKSLEIFKNRRSASDEIEIIARDGNQAPMVSFLTGSEYVTQVVDVGMPLTRAGTVVGSFTDEVTIEIEAGRKDRLSLATMLICTNDGFTGLNSVKLPKSGSVEYYLWAFDSGTEQNTEKSADIVDACSALGALALPGDPNGNENAAVDSQPRGRISPHPGIQGSGDLSTSLHGWSGPVGKVIIERN